MEPLFVFICVFFWLQVWAVLFLQLALQYVLQPVLPLPFSVAVLCRPAVAELPESDILVRSQ